MTNLKDYIYIFATIALTVYGQLVLKWRISLYEQTSVTIINKIKFIMMVVFDPWVMSGLGAAFFASLSWIAAMSKFELAHAYPFMSLNFALILVLSSWLFSEQMTLSKIIGVGLIMFGTMVAARG